VTIELKRAYLEPSSFDGCRILVERLWPRGLKKEDARVDLWLKDVAPSTELRKWFNHDPARWEEFKQRYFDELSEASEAIEEIRLKIKESTVTFVFGSKKSVSIMRWRCGNTSAPARSDADSPFRPPSRTAKLPSL